MPGQRQNESAQRRHDGGVVREVVWIHKRAGHAVEDERVLPSPDREAVEQSLAEAIERLEERAARQDNSQCHALHMATNQESGRGKSGEVGQETKKVE